MLIKLSIYLALDDARLRTFDDTSKPSFARLYPSIRYFSYPPDLTVRKFYLASSLMMRTPGFWTSPSELFMAVRILKDNVDSDSV